MVHSLYPILEHPILSSLWTYCKTSDHGKVREYATEPCSLESNTLRFPAQISNHVFIQSAQQVAATPPHSHLPSTHPQGNPLPLLTASANILVPGLFSAYRS